MSLSPNVKKVVAKNEDAKKALDDLEAMITSQQVELQKAFDANVDTALKSIGIDDAVMVGEANHVRIEYSAEFSLDGVADVVSSALKAAAEASTIDDAQPLLSDDAVDAYCDVISAVAEAAKSSSAAVSEGSFQSTQVGPGTYAFRRRYAVRLIASRHLGGPRYPSAQSHDGLNTRQSV